MITPNCSAVVCSCKCHAAPRDSKRSTNREGFSDPPSVSSISRLLRGGRPGDDGKKDYTIDGILGGDKEELVVQVSQSLNSRIAVDAAVLERERWPDPSIVDGRECEERVERQEAGEGLRDLGPVRVPRRSNGPPATRRQWRSFLDPTALALLAINLLINPL
ncbi:hypothetical protein KM043_016330 [Ampulex compressa]|nr:hypothetical protein KM043_016330 [Ampulex compressa]